MPVRSISAHLVAPYVGAWIETLRFFATESDAASLPMWERGLKPSSRVSLSTLIASLPMWERGLKLFKMFIYQVAISRSLCGSVD